MRKYLFLLLIAYLPFNAFTQQRTKIFLERSDYSEYKSENGQSVTYIRKPTFRQDNAILTCDSAVFYADKNYFEAYRNVHINQADTVNIYSQRLTYDGNSKMAHLSDNVRLLDGESVLTTNILDYDMAAKIGTYITGGKIVNKDIKITSKNGYYFANSRDAYFRYNVVAVTDQTTIKSDTLRYNTLSNWAYFYGPTNITGKDDNLYTENGAYNTKTENAYFGKKNLYTQGSRSLKGDSLYYYGKQGYGKAVKNIVFIDTNDNTLLRGQLGEYYKADERVVVTRNAYLGMGTTDSVMVNDIKKPDTLWLAADTLQTMMVLKKTLKLIPKPVVKTTAQLAAAESPPPKPEKPAKQGTEKGIAGKKTDETKKEGKPEKENKKGLKKETDTALNKPPDSISTSEKPIKPDTLQNQVKTEAVKTDSIAEKVKPDSVKINQVKAGLKDLKADSMAVKGKPDSVKISQVKAGLKDLKADSMAVKGKPDSVKASIVTNGKDAVITDPADTVRARIIKAFYNVRVFKANLQARADSLFYTDADSTLRWYKNPILWSEGSQQTGDTIYAQLKNRKLNTIQIVGNGFIVNVETDSAKFNQIKGKTMLGLFDAGELRRMIVDGNAESIYYEKDDKTNKYTDMNQTVSGRINAYFMDKTISKIDNLLNAEGARTPIAELAGENNLTGFSWKPEQRPTSKQDVIGPPYKKPPAGETKGTEKKPGKDPKKEPLKVLPTETVKEIKKVN